MSTPTSFQEETQFAKRHIRNRFSLMVIPNVSDGVWSVYENAKLICEKNGQPDQILMTFQNLLTRIPEWKDDVLQAEVKRIVAASKCSYLEELLTGVLLTYLRAFAAVQFRGEKEDSVDLQFERPPLSRFIHELYKESARKCWEHAFLFRTVGVRTEQQARNRQDIVRLLDGALDTVLDSFLPWQSIVTKYFSTSEAPVETETVVAEPEPEPEKEPEPAAAKGRSVSFSNDDDESDAETEESDADTEDSDYDDAPPKIKLTEESVDLGDLVKSLDIAVPSKADEKVELTVPTDADTLVLKL
jgi:hypothetical protein